MPSLIRVGIPRAAARVNWSRWLVDCPEVSTHAMQMTYGEPLFTCGTCGAQAEVVWPPEEMAYGIERLLLMRPDEANRNWHPGETLVDLMMENGAHGIFDRIGLNPGESGLTVTDGSIRRDVLPVTHQRTLRAVAA